MQVKIPSAPVHGTFFIILQHVGFTERVSKVRYNFASSWRLMGRHSFDSYFLLAQNLPADRQEVCKKASLHKALIYLLIQYPGGV